MFAAINISDLTGTNSKWVILLMSKKLCEYNFDIIASFTSADWKFDCELYWKAQTSLLVTVFYRKLAVLIHVMLYLSNLLLL
jgi:hypothetical protein